MTDEHIARAEAEGSLAPPPPPLALTFDIVWIDPDRSPVLFMGITGSDIADQILTLHADRITHLINMRVVSHVNIWQEEP